MAAPLAHRPSAAAVVGEAAGARLPAYVTREQARAVIAAAQSTRDRLLFECLWQTGGRVTEVLRLRRGDVDAREGALRLANLKQRRRALREKLVYVSPELLRDLLHYAKDLRQGPGDHFFTSRKTDAPGASGAPMTRQHAWWLLRREAAQARVRYRGRTGARGRRRVWTSATAPPSTSSARGCPCPRCSSSSATPASTRRPSTPS
jgi:integrase